MKVFPLLAILAGCCLTACAHHQPKSSARIIMEGEENPNIRSDVQRAGERVHVMR